MLFTPIYTRNVISDEMKKDFKLFNILWVEYCNVLPITGNAFDVFANIMNKIRINHFNFDEKELGHFNELLTVMQVAIYRDINNGIVFDEEDEIIYDDEHGEYVYKTLFGADVLDHYNKIATYLKFMSESVLDYGKMKEMNAGFCEELCQKVFHPVRVSRIADNLGVEVYDYLDTI